MPAIHPCHQERKPKENNLSHQKTEETVEWSFRILQKKWSFCFVGTRVLMYSFWDTVAMNIKRRSTVKDQLNVSKYTSPMDPMSMRNIFPGCLWCTWMLMLSDIYFSSKFGFAARMDHTDVMYMNNEGNDATPPRRYPQLLYQLVVSKISFICYPYTLGEMIQFDEYIPIGFEENRLFGVIVYPLGKLRCPLKVDAWKMK